jgi:hypothetical protein
MAVALETALNGLGVDTYTVVLVDNKFLFTSSFNDFTINPNDVISTGGILSKIGFGISGIYTATAGELLSYSGINLLPCEYIYVNIDQLLKHIKNSQGVFHNFIIPNSCNYGGIVTYKPESTFIQQYIPYTNIFPSNTDTYNLSLRYEDGSLIDLQNSDWIIVLDFEVIGAP